MNGFLLVDKPAGYTSNDILNILKKRLGFKKMGHTGTLDPFATGLLLVGLGSALKQIPHLNEEPKIYSATLKLGEKTDTMDLTGRIIETAAIPSLSETEIRDKLSPLIGPQEQIPPMYSAKKIGGKKLYELARQGISVPRKPVPITIYNLEFLPDMGSLTPGHGEPVEPLNPVSGPSNLLLFRVSCSRGTYVRVLGETIAEHLGTVGHLTSLRRLSAGAFSVTDAVDPLGDWKVEEKLLKYSNSP